MPTSDCIKRFRHEGLREDYDLEAGDRFIGDLFEHLTYEQEALLMLDVYAKDIAEDVAYGIDAERLYNHIVFLGQQIHELLRMLRLYQRGYLFHQFVQWWGTDIMVGDFRCLDLEPAEEEA